MTGLHVYHNDLPNPLKQPRLDQQRHIQHASPLPSQPTSHHLRNDRSPHRWVNNPVQRSPLLLIVEHYLADRLAVEGDPVGLEDAGTEVREDLFVAAGTGLDDGAG